MMWDTALFAVRVVIFFNAQEVEDEEAQQKEFDVKTFHNPRDYIAGRRVSCSSGFIRGTPIPLLSLDKYVPVAKVDATRKERYRQGCLKAWKKRRANGKAS